jgi:hypothetical protein
MKSAADRRQTLEKWHVTFINKNHLTVIEFHFKTGGFYLFCILGVELDN